MDTNPKKNIAKIIAILILLILLSALAYFMLSAKSTETPPTQTTPAGETAGITKTIAPDSKPTDSMKNWKTATDGNTGTSFKYPEHLPTKYISGADWPPTLQILEEPFSCKETGNEIAPGGKTEKRTIDGRPYCITQSSEGAAGSIYTTYTYAFLNHGKTTTFNFILRAIQCGNYDDPKKTECEKERASFNPDEVVALMASSME